MIDIKQIRENPQKFKTACETKGFTVDIDKLLVLDDQIREVKNKLQDLATEKNRIGKSIPKLSGEEKENAFAKLMELKEKEKDLEIEGQISIRWLNMELEKTEAKFSLDEALKEFNDLMLQVAQPTDEDVPLGKDDTENVEIRKEGQVKQFDFEPKDHVQLGTALGIIDIERGVKLAGTRNYILKGDGALLHWAILRFAMDYMVGKGCTRQI